jgi:uncharacterized protein YecT (DUF1311 family)
MTPTGRRGLGILAASLAGMSGAPLHAAPADPFAYTMEITPEQGPTDPVIERCYTRAFATCQDHANGTPGIADCFMIEFGRQDAVLNRTWKATLARLPAAAHKPLIQAQRKWAAARDPFCRDRSDEFSGGTIAPVIYVSCRAELTIRRTLWLERLR